MPFFTGSTLLLAIGIIEILLGTAVLASPLPTGAGLPPPPPDALTAYGTAFVFFGVIAFILHVAQSTLTRVWRVAGNVLIALPLLAAAGYAFRRDVIIAGALYAALALVNIALAGWGRPAGGDHPTMDALGVTLFVLEAAVGIFLLATPSVFRVPIYAELLTFRVPAGALMLLGAVALVLSSRTRRVFPRVAAGFVAGLPLLVVTGAIIRAQGAWLGVFVYPILAGFLVAEPWLERSLLAQSRAVSERPSVAAYQRTIEGVIWAVILLVTIAGNVQPVAAYRLLLYAVALGASLFTLVWFRLPPAARPQIRTLWGAAVYAALAGLVTYLTGGVRTPLIFVLLLPILAVAWTLPPRYITVPAGIALLTLALEVGSHIVGGEPPGEILSIAVFRASGLAFVAVFAYFLARRASDQRLLARQEKRKLETIVSSMGDSLLVLDAHGRIQFCNRAAERLLGVPPDGAVGRPVAEVLALRREGGLAWSAEEDPLAAAIRGEATRQRVLVIRPGDATPFPCALTVMPLQEGEGRGAGVICTLRDVAPELEIGRMREDFFNIASHEIRTPLTVIKGHVELVLDGTLGELEETARHVLTEVYTATDRLIRMVNDFLDAARVEEGKISVQIDRGDLTILVQQAVAALTLDAKRKGLTLTYRLPDPGAVPPVLMDAGKALQVLINLIDNGIKFTARGGVEIWHAAEDGTVATYVADTGVGIRPDQRHRLFERFSQLERGLRRETGGSGLGLYISRKLAEHMNGTVSLKESVPDGGSTFVFVLPAAPGPVRTEAAASSRARTASR